MKKQEITSQDRLINHIRDTARKEQAIDYFETIWNNNPETKGKTTIKKMMWEAYQYGKQQEKDIKAEHLAGHYIKGKEEALQIIDNWLKNYPEDIFPKITPSLLKKASDFFMTNFGFPLDRLSAHILRDALIKIKGEIENENNNS